MHILFPAVDNSCLKTTITDNKNGLILLFCY